MIQAHNIFNNRLFSTIIFLTLLTGNISARTEPLTLFGEPNSAHQRQPELEITVDNPLFSIEASPLPSATKNPLLWENEEKAPLEAEFTKILPPEQAFVFSHELELPNVISLHWQIAHGYYLYRDKLQFTLVEGNFIGNPQLPPAIRKEDIKYGQIDVYENNLTIKLPLLDTQGLNTLTLKVAYQGCAEARLCYPPLENMVKITLPNHAVASTNNEVNTVASNNNLPPSSENPTTPLSLLDKFLHFLGLKKTNPSYLQPDEAFVLSAEFSNENYLTARWHIAENYYLYRDKIKFQLQSQGTLDTPQFPPAKLRHDKLFGDVSIYQQPLLEIKIPLLPPPPTTVTLQVEYQGCAVGGLCYPPLTKIIDLTLGKNAPLSEQDQIAKMLANANIFYTLLLFFGFGLLLSLTPCIYPMIPILSGIIVGQGQQVTTRKAFLMSLTYVFAMATTYAIAGVLTGLLGENLQVALQKPWAIITFVLIFIALALAMFGCYELQLPSSLQTRLANLSNRQQGGTLIGVAIMGILSALIVGPCVAAPLAGALIYIGQTGNAWLGGLALFIMSFGMGIPLIIIGISAGHWLPRAGEWMTTIKAIFGVMLLATAIWMLDRIVPKPITLLLTACLLIIIAIYLGALDSLNVGISGWRRLWKGVGLILLIYGILLMIGAMSGNNQLWQPLLHLKSGVSNSAISNNANSTTQSPFKYIKGLDELEQQLALAKTANKPVLLDFYADWCVSCEEMEVFTFSDAEVQKLFTQFILLKTDVTANDEQDKSLYKRFNIYGPPAIVFFDQNGLEITAFRLIGFIPVKQFRQHLLEVLQQ